MLQYEMNGTDKITVREQTQTCDVPHDDTLTS